MFTVFFLSQNLSKHWESRYCRAPELCVFRNLRELKTKSDLQKVSINHSLFRVKNIEQRNSITLLQENIGLSRENVGLLREKVTLLGEVAQRVPRQR